MKVMGSELKAVTKRRKQIPASEAVVLNKGEFCIAGVGAGRNPPELFVLYSMINHAMRGSKRSIRS